MMEAFQRLSLALAIGILVGIERGWQEREAAPGKRVAGIRTYGLSSFLGGLCGFLQPVTGPILPVAIFAFFCITILVFSTLQAARDEDYSATAAIAAIMVFVLGFSAVVADMTVTAAGAVAITVLLATREPLHGFLRRLTWLELRAALILLTMTVVVLPILPNAPIDRWQTINPFELWMMTILVGAVSFAGYVLIRLTGARAGILMTGASGGIVSSTALTLSFARQSSQTLDCPICFRPVQCWRGRSPSPAPSDLRRRWASRSEGACTVGRSSSHSLRHHRRPYRIVAA